MAQGTGNAQHAPLGGEVEAVAGLDLDRGDAAGLEAGEPPPRRCQQLVLAGSAGGGDGGPDPATPSRDLGVGDALQAQLELVRPVAAEDEMGVAVDQPRRHPGAGEILDLRRLAVRQVRHRP